MLGTQRALQFSDGSLWALHNDIVGIVRELLKAKKKKLLHEGYIFEIYKFSYCCWILHASSIVSKHCGFSSAC